MNVERGRCLFSLLIVTVFLLGTAYGQNTTTMAPTTTPATTPPMTTTGQAIDSLTTVLSTTISPTTPDPCSGIDCENGGTCNDSTNPGTCDCAAGWTGALCSEDVDECSYPHNFPCDRTNGICTNNDGSYTCTCKTGYVIDLVDNSVCNDVDECSPQDPNDYPCNGTYGNCTNTDGSYTCTCDPGYELDPSDNSTCNEINECDPNPCQNGGTCTDMVNGYSCTCLEGKFNGTICEIDLDACDPDPCENGNCTNLPMYPNDADYNCTCSPGWMGRNCSEDIRECTHDDDDPCYNNATCIEQPGSYECNCTPGFTGNNCEINCPADTYGAYCVGTCTCVAKADCSRIDGSCTCVPAFDGAVCDKRDLTVTAMQISPDDAISEGNNFTLACEVNLAQADLEEVAWYRSGERLPYETNRDYLNKTDPDMGEYNLTIRSAGAKDTGNYSCTAVAKGNQFNDSSDIIVINVLVVGKIIDGAFDDRVRLNETAMLNCTAFSSQPLTLAWERHGQPLSTGNRTTVTNETGLVTPGGTYYSIILEVTGIVRADNGIYQCIVMDQDGNETDRGDFSIFVEEVPELSNPRYDKVGARNLTIGWNEYNVNSATDNCTAFYNASGDDMISQYMFSNPSLQGTILGLTPHTVYSVSLICQNEVGPSERLEYQDKQTLQDAPEAPTNVTVNEVTAKSAKVRWVAPLVLNGDLAGYTIYAQRQPDCGISCLDLLGDVGPNVLSYPMTLSPGVEYRAIVRAFNRENGRRMSSPDGRSQTFRTLPILPGAPSDVESDEPTNPDYCIITWSAPEEPNGIIQAYNVKQETYLLNSRNIDNTTIHRVDRGQEWKRLKSDLPPYSDFEFSVSAINEVGEGDYSAKVTCTNPVIGVPMPPAALEEPSAKNHYSFTTTFPTYSERNGPVSCYEVVVVQLQDATAVVNPDDDMYSPGKVGEYKDRGIGIPYIALVTDNALSEITIGIGKEDDEPSTCPTGGSPRQRRSTVTPGQINGVNGPLNPNGIYTSFVRVYSPRSEDEVYFENGPVMAAVTLDGRPPNTGAIVGAIFGVIIALCIAFVVFLMYRRRQQEVGDPLMTPTTNGPRENGNGTLIGMENLGIEDEMVVEPIKLERLEKAIREKAKDEKKVFWDEYKALPNRPPPMVTMNSSNHPANKDKNRYINIIAYDHTRVKLKHVDGIEGSDYINASYVNGYQSPDKFIAAQGPKDNTLEDFWRMIWECNCSTIVMLTKCVEDGKDKCSQYWPNTGSVKYGRFEVKLDEVKETAEYVIRSFFLSENGKETGQRSITQFHFLGWPDHGQPDYPNPMLCLIKRVRHLTSKMNHRANIVVHCSAGVGRTGTYIVIDAMLDKMKHEKQVDIYNFIHEIRQQRNTLVQSFVQYFFIHIALLEEHLFGHMDVGMSDFPAYYQQLSNKSDYNEDLTRLEEEFRRACKLGVNGTEQTYANIDQNKDKNRIGHILPFDKNIVKLERLIGEEFSDYINASYITGYDRKNMYIATQGPLPNTIADFWRMIWESQTSTIVMLTETTEKGHEMCAQYWPLEVDEVEEHGNISVTLIDESDEDEAFTVRDIEISHAQVMQNIYGNIDKEGEGPTEAADSPEGESAYGNVPDSPPPTPMKDIRKIRQYHFRGWPEVGVPDTGIDLMRLVNKSHLHQKERGAHPIVVHCSAGAGRTGVFIGLNILMSRMEEESMIDVFQTVRGLRQQRPHMVQDLAQYKFCYLAMVEYIQDQSTEYQNFVPRV